jgi:hypothetical protein
MTERRNAMIDQVFERLVTAPNGLDPTVVEVLIAIGRFTGAILKEGYADADRDRVTTWFRDGLRSYVNRTNAVVRALISRTLDALHLKAAAHPGGLSFCSL